MGVLAWLCCPIPALSGGKDFAGLDDDADQQRLALHDASAPEGRAASSSQASLPGSPHNRDERTAASLLNARHPASDYQADAFANSSAREPNAAQGQCPPEVRLTAGPLAESDDDHAADDGNTPASRLLRLGKQPPGHASDTDDGPETPTVEVRLASLSGGAAEASASSAEVSRAAASLPPLPAGGARLAAAPLPSPAAPPSPARKAEGTSPARAAAASSAGPSSPRKLVSRGASIADAASSAASTAAFTASAAAFGVATAVERRKSRGLSFERQRRSSKERALVAASPPPAETDAFLLALEHAVAQLPNKNRLPHYAWLADLLAQIAGNRAPAVDDVGTRVAGAPLFAVAGGCPNPFAGMQVVLYSLMRAAPPQLDFWWVKPSAADGARLEEQTLRRQGKGPHKNDPGRSRALYLQFAELFDLSAAGGGAAANARAGAGRLGFEVAQVAGGWRAFIEQLASGERYYLYLLWLEDWTSNPFARSKYLKGKLVYQREPQSERYFARPFAYRDGVLSVPAGAEAEESVAAVLPTDAIKLGCDAV